MDESGPRGGAMKPVILRVFVAFVVSATGLIMARFVCRKEDNEVSSAARNPDSSSSPRSRLNDREEEAESLDQEKQDIVSLKARFEELERKEYEMELQFKRYCNMRDQEVMLIEHKSMLRIEKSELEYFRREVMAMEEEQKRGQDLVILYLKLVGEIQELRSENGLLEEKAKKLRRKTKQFNRVVNEMSRKMIGVEKELLKCNDELEKKNNVVKELEGEVKDLKACVDVLQQEKEELLFLKSSNSSSEMVSVEDYRKVIEEYEELKKEYANGVKEVINLRWSNACLRHEVMRNGTNYGEIVFSQNGNLRGLGFEDDQTDNTLALTVADDQHEEMHNNSNHHHHESSKRKRFMKKLKKWVEGDEKGKSKAEERCFGRHLLTIEPEEEHIFNSRRSCSSV